MEAKADEIEEEMGSQSYIWYHTDFQTFWFIKIKCWVTERKKWNFSYISDLDAWSKEQLIKINFRATGKEGIGDKMELANIW